MIHHLEFFMNTLKEDHKIITENPLDYPSSYPALEQMKYLDDVEEFNSE